MIKISNDLKLTYPNAKFGILIIKDVVNLPNHTEFIKTKTLITENLLKEYENYDRKEFVKSEPVCFYKDYYKKFKKTYPVLLQLESIVVKANPLPNASTLVESMFIAELKNMLLTAAHDFDKIQFPLQLQLSQGNESFIGISGREQFTTANDMMLSDDNGIISSILNGPDHRTQVASSTKNVVFYVYAPNGVEDDTITNHLKDIISYVSIFSPDAKVDLLDIF